MSITRRTVSSIISQLFGYSIIDSVGILYAQETSALIKLRERIIKIESDAESKGIKFSNQGTRNKSTPIRTENLYLDALPRLIELQEAISISKNDQDLSSDISELLSELNNLERSPADYWSSISRGPKPSVVLLKEDYLKLFESCKIIPAYRSQVAWHTDIITRHKVQYESVSAQTKIPWYFIGITHGLEASYNFKAHLHNGDVPLDQLTRQVPKNRPQPWSEPYTWEKSAIDALTLMKLTQRTDWGLAEILYRLEAFNGFGYRSSKIKINSPYLWSFSSHYTKGKYRFDGKYDPALVSKQCGAAVILKSMVISGIISL